MTAINTYTAQALAKYPTKSVGFANDLKTVTSTYELTDSLAQAAGSFLYMVRIPKGAYITSGRVYGDPLDSSGTSSALMSVHIGYNGPFTGVDGTAYTAASATTAFGASLAWGPDAVTVTGVKATNTRNFAFGGLLVTNGPLLTTDEGTVYIYFTASALAFTSGTIAMEVQYYQLTHA